MQGPFRNNSPTSRPSVLAAPGLSPRWVAIMAGGSLSLEHEPIRTTENRKQASALNAGCRFNFVNLLELDVLGDSAISDVEQVEGFAIGRQLQAKNGKVKRRISELAAWFARRKPNQRFHRDPQTTQPKFR